MSKIYNLEFKVISARFGGSKEKLSEDSTYKFRIYFSRKNTQKGIIENFSTTKVELKDSLMYFNNESIRFSDIDISSDRLEISFVLIKDTIKRYKPLVISINSLTIGIEKEEIWTLSSQSLINLTYIIESETPRKHLLDTENDNDSKTIINCNKKREEDILSLNKNNLKRIAFDRNVTVKNKNAISSSDNLKRTPGEAPVLSLIGRNNDSPLIEKTKTFFECSSNKKKSEIATSLFQKTFQIDHNGNTADSNTNVFLNDHTMKLKDYEIIESKDISSLENINEKSTIGNNTTNNSSNPLENFENFIQAIFISGLFTETRPEIIKSSEVFLAPCSHQECSFLPSYKPNILYSYINKTAQPKPEINNLVANMGFPLGIKLCYYCQIDKNKKMNHTPRPQQSFYNVMKNEQNEFFYVATLQYFIKMTIKDFENIYQINPLKEYASTNCPSKPSNNKDKDNKTHISIQLLSELMINENILIPESLSLVSKYPYFSSMETCLKAIISLHQEDMHRLISHIINEIPIPPQDNLVLFYLPKSTEPVKVYSPISSDNESVSLLNYKFLLDFFSLENIILIFQLILLEQKILFLHNNYQELSKISFLFTSLIYPFFWINPYIPVLNLSTVQFLQSFIPYIMGIDEYLLKYAELHHYLNQGEVIIIDIKKDTIILNKNRKKISRKNATKELGLPELPDKIMTFLLTELKMIKKCTIADMGVMNRKIKEVFIQVMIMLIGDYKSFTFIVDEDMPLFNKESFISNHQQRDMKSFLTELISTQIFNQFLFNEKQLSKVINQLDQDDNVINSVNGDNVSSFSTLNLFDTSYFKQMIPKYQALINVQQVRKRSNSVLNKHDQRENKEKSIPNHINSSFHNPVKEENVIANSLFNSNIDKKESPTKKDSNSITCKKIKTYVLLPYFITNPIMSLDKKKIQNYIDALLKKAGVKDINSVEHHCFIISKKKGYQFSSLLSKKKYYLTPFPSNADNKERLQENKSSLISKSAAVSPQHKQGKEEVTPSLFSIELFNCTNMNTIKKCESVKNLTKMNANDNILPLNHQLLLSDCFKNICTSKKKIIANQFELLNQILQLSLGRDCFIKLLFPEEAIANEENHKQLIHNSYDDLLYLINLCLRYIKHNEYKGGRLLTLACFSYYKIDKSNKVKYIYEDLINGAYPTNLWTEEEFWNFFCNEEIQAIRKDDANEVNIEERLLTVMDIMMRLKLNKTLVKKVVIENKAAKLLPENTLTTMVNKLVK